MANALQVAIVTPDRVLLEIESTSVVAPGALGSFGVLPNHAPLLAELGVGEVRLRDRQGEEHRFAVQRGFLQVSGNRVTILADAAERAEEIDIETARTQLAAAEEALRQARTRYDDRAASEAEAAAEWARSRLRVAGFLK